MISARTLSRRRVLRGILGGAAVSVSLPLLDCFLNDHGTAFADGGPLPPCFGSWFYGLGLTPGYWEPKQTGANYQMNESWQVLTKYQKRINIFSGLDIMTDGRSVDPHATGPAASLLGLVPRAGEALPASVDSLIADVIGKSTRFRSIEMACNGDPGSFSRTAGAANGNPSETSPVRLYARIFGSGYTDPNAANFKPDPALMLQHSVLSAVAEERTAYVRGLSVSDRSRLDEYFTSLRQVEQQLEIETRKPAPAVACSIPTKEDEAPQDENIDNGIANHRHFMKLIAHAMACNQTRVFNLRLTPGASGYVKEGEAQTFHAYTHEESVDPKTGQQPTVTWFQQRQVAALAEALDMFDSFKEGDRTLLDRMLVLTSTDTGHARIHSNQNLPFMTIGNGGGRMKTGIHVAAKGDPVTRVGLTVQQAMGVPTSEWGQNSLATSKTFTEVLS